MSTFTPSSPRDRVNVPVAYGVPCTCSASARLPSTSTLIPRATPTPPRALAGFPVSAPRRPDYFTPSATNGA